MTGLTLVRGDLYETLAVSGEHMRIPDSKVEEVAAAANIVEVISDYVELKKAGKDYRGLCPFHGEKDPSFYVSPQKDIFHCFGCAAGGSVFSFLMRIENISFVEAVRNVAQRYGVALDYDYSPSRNDEAKDRIQEALNEAQRYFRDQLLKSDAALSYLRNRGVPDEWAEKLGVGFAPDSWNGLSDHLRRANIGAKYSLAAGLIRERASGGHYDYFRSRVTIPIYSLAGNVTAFGGRILGAGEPKYLNSPDTRVFRKKESLFGLERARDAIRQEGFVVLVEGYFDRIALEIGGLANAVAPLGTALGREQIRLIRRFTDNIVTVFDGDEAGIRAVKRSIPLFLAEGVEPRCLILKDYKDPDEAVNSIGIEGFRRLLDTSVSQLEFLLDYLEAQYDLKTVHGKNLALEESIPVLLRIADSKERDYLIERFRNRIGIREDRLQRLLESRRNRQRTRSASGDIEKKTLYDFPADERNVVRGMLLKEGFVDRVLQSGVLKDLEDPTMKRLAESIVDFSDRSDRFESSSFARSIEDSGLASIVAAWLQPRPVEDDLRPEVEGDAALDQSLDNLRLRKLAKRKTEIQDRMRKCIPCDEEYNRLAQELLDIGRRLHARR